MQSKIKVFIGLGLFLGLITFPVWNNLLRGGKKNMLAKPQLTTEAKQAGQCVEDKDYMRKSHMILLNRWRDMLVRKNIREYKSKAHGKTYRISLTKTCLGCHSNTKDFCGACHKAAAVQTYCFDCHIAPNAKYKSKFTKKNLMRYHPRMHPDPHAKDPHEGDSRKESSQKKGGQ